MRHRFMIALIGLVLAASVAMAAAPVSPYDETTLVKPVDRQLQIDPAKDLGDPVDLNAALAAGAYYLRHAQADVSEDNAGNGPNGAEIPEDPDDAGWDWSLTDPNYTHSTAPSPLNLYGVTALGIYYSYLAAPNPGLFTALTDAAMAIIGNPNIHTSSDIIFLMKYNELPLVSGTTYQDAAKAKFDARVASSGSATAFAQAMRDARAGYHNGIIGWDLGAWAVAAQMLDARYPAGGYASAADDIAEVLYQDSFQHNPGLFDVVEDAGFDPTYATVDYWWYNLGISGLIDAFRASGTHTAEIPGLAGRLLASQTPQGAVCGSYGVHENDEDWQSTAYAAVSLAALYQPSYRPAIRSMTYFLGGTQHSSGGWIYSDLSHYPEIGGENTAAMFFGRSPTNVVVDDDFLSQVNVNAYNALHGTNFVLGYDAFASIQVAINAVSGSTVTVLPGLYVGNLDITLNGLILNGPNAGIAGNGARGAEAILDGNNLSATIAVNANNVVIDGFKIIGGANGLNAGVWNGGVYSGTVIQNNVITDNCIGVFPQSNGPVLIKNNLIDGNNRPGPAGGTGIYADNSNLLNIQGNEIRNHTTNSAVTLGATGPATHVGLSFTNNLVHDNLSGVYCVSLNGALFSGNNFSSMPGGTGLTLSGSCAHVDVLANTFTGLLRGFRIVDHGYNYGNNADAEAHNNNFSACSEFAIGLLSGYATPLDASCNWWDDLGGPNVLPGNPSLGEPLNQTGGSVIYWPWLNAAAPGGACGQYGPNNVAIVAPAGCLTPANPCLPVTVRFNRADTTPLRGISVRFQLGPELVLCGATPIVAGSLWNTYTILDPLIVDNHDGSYTVDIAVVGNCGPVTGGDVFTVTVAKAAAVVGNASGTITVTGVTVRDCNNVPLPGIPGLPAEVSINPNAPAAVTNLVVTQDKSGNGADGRTAINLAWAPLANPENDLQHVEIYRKGFGAYPEYDDAGGATPALPIDASWQVVDLNLLPTAISFVDEPATRDFWYYAVKVVDDCGNSSVVMSTTGTLDYHLGDVVGPPPNDAGNNLVNTADISALGASYGINLVPSDPVNYLDVGPTTDFSVNARPTTDNRVQFEDLIMFAINFGVVSKENLPSLTPAAESAVVAKVGAVDPTTSTLTVEIAMSGNGRVQGLSVPLTWDDAVVRPVGFTAGNLIADQGGFGLVLSPVAGTIDAAIFGVRDQGICGTGTLAVVTFAVLGAGDPAIGLGEVAARDAVNQTVTVSGELAQPGLVAPLRTELLANTPNPFNPSTELSFLLAQPGSVRLQIYSVQGRLVATLVNGELAAGRHDVTWRGLDDAGRAVASGAYIVRLDASGDTQSRRITLMK